MMYEFIVGVFCTFFACTAVAEGTPVDEVGINETGTGWTNIVYFTGIGCPHCANSDPFLLKERVRRGDVMIFEYEIYRDRENGPLLMKYHKEYGAELMVPQIIAGKYKKDIAVGDRKIIKEMNSIIFRNKGNSVTLVKEEVSFGEVDLNAVYGKPKIWFKDRVALRKGEVLGADTGNIVKAFLLEQKIPQKCADVLEKEIPLSGGEAVFDNACSYDGWLFMYGGV